MKDVRTVVFEKCYVMSKMFRGGGGFDQDALGLEWHQSLSHNIIKLSVQMVYVLSTPHAYKCWPKLKRIKPFFFPKRPFCNILHMFLVNWNYLQMFSPVWRWFIVALLWRSWTDFCCRIKKKKKKKKKKKPNYYSVPFLDCVKSN